MASTRPPGRARPERQAGQPLQRGDRAGDHHVGRQLPGHVLGAAAADRGVGQAERPGRTPSRNAARRAIGSSSMISASGSSIAMTTPGSPAPEPRSITEHGCGISSATAAQFSRCRSHSRAGSRGPDEAALHARPGQQLGVALGQRRAPGRTSSRACGGAGGAGLVAGTGTSRGLAPAAPADSVRQEERPPDGPAPRPRTRCAARRPPPRHARSCARTGSSPRASWARRCA